MHLFSQVFDTLSFFAYRCVSITNFASVTCQIVQRSSCRVRPRSSMAPYWETPWSLVVDPMQIQAFSREAKTLIIQASCQTLRLSSARGQPLLPTLTLRAKRAKGKTKSASIWGTRRSMDRIMLRLMPMAAMGDLPAIYLSKCSSMTSSSLDRTRHLTQTCQVFRIVRLRRTRLVSRH